MPPDVHSPLQSRVTLTSSLIAILVGIVAGLFLVELGLRLVLGETYTLGLGWYGSERVFHERALSDETRAGIR